MIQYSLNTPSPGISSMVDQICVKKVEVLVNFLERQDSPKRMLVQKQLEGIYTVFSLYSGLQNKLIHFFTKSLNSKDFITGKRLEKFQTFSTVSYPL